MEFVRQLMIGYHSNIKHLACSRHIHENNEKNRQTNNKKTFLDKSNILDSAVIHFGAVDKPTTQHNYYQYAVVPRYKGLSATHTSIWRHLWTRFGAKNRSASDLAYATYSITQHCTIFCMNGAMAN